MKEDYSLAGMMKAMRAANGGKQLSAKQEALVEAMHNEIAEKQKAHDDYVADAEERDREAALDAAFERMKEKVQQEARASKRVSPSDPDFGNQNKLFTRAEADTAKARLKAHFQGAHDNDNLDSMQTNVKPTTIYRRVYDILVKVIKKFKPPMR